MTKQELALQYFPDAIPETAVRHLRRWIACCTSLVEALDKTGYQSRNRSLTWRQVLLIREFLGEPAEPEGSNLPSLPPDGHKRTQTDTADLPSDTFASVKEMQRTSQTRSVDKPSTFSEQA